ncbi:CAP domain-containing protein [Virgibacillus siamensis]|uniref:CAP domain-containing protein n=1 Tax=Virgibacillus siamensis TaxID=480071 RepID=UPI0009873B37|nr:CAP domain-containing protein [Virgibacillus siamensis]
MRFILGLVGLLVIVAGGFYLLDKTPEEAINHTANKLEHKNNLVETKKITEHNPVPLDGDLYQWIGKDTDDLMGKFGKPVRKDMSAYGYVWWVYKKGNKQYVQFGVEDNKVMTIYAIGDNLSLEPIHLGQKYKGVKKTLDFSDEVTYSSGLSSYTFKLKNRELESRPLAKLTDQIFMQCYMDTFTNKLSSVRIATGEVLLEHRPYAMEYRGKLPAKPDLSKSVWDKVENGMEKQIFDITNVMRSTHGKSSLKWNKEISKVAFKHSKDMAVNNYFSHYSKNGAGLKERLASQEVYYRAAGENIAAKYPDAPSAMNGWLNSKGHREALLNDGYTHLGAGVYHFYYTQNFLQLPR